MSLKIHKLHTLFEFLKNPLNSDFQIYMICYRLSYPVLAENLQPEESNGSNRIHKLYFRRLKLYEVEAFSNVFIITIFSCCSHTKKT